MIIIYMDMVFLDMTILSKIVNHKKNNKKIWLKIK